MLHAEAMRKADVVVCTMQASAKYTVSDRPFVLVIDELTSYVQALGSEGNFLKPKEKNVNMNDMRNCVALLATDADAVMSGVPELLFELGLLPESANRVMMLQAEARNTHFAREIRICTVEYMDWFVGWLTRLFYGPNATPGGIGGQMATGGILLGEDADAPNTGRVERDEHGHHLPIGVSCTSKTSMVWIASILCWPRWRTLLQDLKVHGEVSNRIRGSAGYNRKQAPRNRLLETGSYSATRDSALSGVG